MTPDAPIPEERPVASWVERRAEAEALCATLATSLPSTADLDAVRAFAADPKWEVRKVIANALSYLPEPVFRDLAPVLSNDSNAFVCRAAQRSCERKVPVASLDSSPTGEVQQAIDRITARHGGEAAQDAVKLAHLVTERHLKSLAHDLKNILNSLAIDPEKFPDVTGHQRRKLIRCKQNTDYLAHLAKVMANYAAEPKLKCKDESLEEMIVEAHSSAVAQIEAGGRSTAGVEFVFALSEGLTVRVSRFHIVMVLTNLIKNGIEAHAVSDTEIRSGKVTVKAEMAESELFVGVADTGRGISPGDLVQLREFMPGGSSKKKTAAGGGSGTGYGLPICRRYVEAHGGALSIESTEGEGTRVVFRLPQGGELGD